MSRSYAVSYTTVCFNSCFWNCCSKFQHECNSTAMMKIDGLNVLKPGNNPHEWLLRLMRLLHVNGKKLQLVSGDTESKSFLTFNFTSFNMLLSLKFSVTLAGYSSANPWLVHSPVGPDCCWFSKVYIPFSDCRLRFYRKKPVALARSSKVRQINTARESKQKQVINTKRDGKALTRSCVWTEQLRHRARMQFTYKPSP